MDYYEVFLHGEYFAQMGDKRELRPYSTSFKLPNAEKPLSVILKKLLKPYLLQEDSKFVDVYTHHVDEITFSGRTLDPNEIPIRFQSKDQLKEYIKYHKLHINVDEYGSLGLLRDHVRMAKEEPENWQKTAEKFAQKKADEKELFALNADKIQSPGMSFDEEEQRKRRAKPSKAAKAGKKSSRSSVPDSNQGAQSDTDDEAARLLS